MKKWFSSRPVAVQAAIIAGICAIIAAIISIFQYNINPPPAATPWANIQTRGSQNTEISASPSNTILPIPQSSLSITLAAQASPMGNSTTLPSSTPIPYKTKSPSAIQTITPKPECKNPQVDSLQFILSPGTRTKIPDDKSHITLTTNETSGLIALTGKAIFKDSGVISNCTCTWKGQIQNDEGYTNDIDTKSYAQDCGFSLPLKGSVKIANLYLSVDGQPISIFVIEFP